MKKAILIMSFQYSVNVIGLPLYIRFYEWKNIIHKSKFHK